MTMDADKLDREARQIMQENDRGGYTVPTGGLYPFQWNWDSCFAAWGFAAYDVPRAWEEVKTLFASQWDSGMVPHIIFHKRVESYFVGPDLWGVKRTPPTSGLTQPPVAATLIRAIYEADKDYGSKEIEPIFEGLMRWHCWFMACRVDRGMVAITHPWESGRDNCNDWDLAMAAVDTSGVGEYFRKDTSHVNPEMRPKKADYDAYLAMLFFSRDCGWDEAHIRAHGPFRVADVGMTFILLRACRDLLALARELGKPTGDIESWIAQLEQGVGEHWNPNGYYDSVNLKTGAFTNSLSSASFLNWYAGVENEAMLDHLHGVLDAVSFGLPSFDPRAEGFEPLRYWRGPVWIQMNALIAIGLAECGHQDLADRLRTDSQKLIETSGFYEYYSPLDATPAGGATFTWTAASWLSWASPHAKGRF